MNRGIVAIIDQEESFERDNCEDFTDFYIGIQRTRISNHLRRGEVLNNLAKKVKKTLNSKSDIQYTPYSKAYKKGFENKLIDLREKCDNLIEKVK